MEKFKLDENGKLNDVEQMRVIIHALSVGFMQIASDHMQELLQRLGPMGALAFTDTLTRIHAATCTGEENSQEGGLNEWLSRMQPPVNNSSSSLN